MSQLPQAFVVDNGDSARGIVQKIENIFHSISWGYIVLLAVIVIPGVGSSAVQSVATPYLENKYGTGTTCSCAFFGYDPTVKQVMCLDTSNHFTTTSLDQCKRKCNNPLKCSNQVCAGHCQRTSAHCAQSLPYSLES